MGDLHEPPVCRSCGATGGTVCDRGLPSGPLCDPCFAEEVLTTDERQAIEEGATALAPPAPPSCLRCGTPRDRCETGYGHYLLLEPGPALPVAVVPVGHRWFIAGDGRAVNWTGARPLARHCRVAHRHVCGHRPHPELLAPVFTALWLHNRAVAGLPLD
ncbi:DUF6083 domain-containing protein [Streptomyces sp. NPDC046215]|uniref:Uncharacterized protein n=1 Tax=Streptomyces stramineus TaxID=173861 RepID=A0ABN0ZKQ3_9ACTN